MDEPDMPKFVSARHIMYKLKATDPDANAVIAEIPELYEFVTAEPEWSELLAAERECASS